MTVLSLTVVYQEVEAGWTQARLADVPGVITAGRTREEARDLLVDALEQFLKSHAVGTGSEGPSSADTEELRLVLSP